MKHDSQNHEPRADGGDADADADADAERGRLLVAAAVRPVTAPPSLRARVEEDVARARSGRALGGREDVGWRKRMFGGNLGLAGALAAVAAIVVLVVLGVDHNNAPPTAQAVAAAAVRVDRGAPPRVSEADPRLLRKEVGGVRFPNWKRIDWPAVSSGATQVAGREVGVVGYADRRGMRVIYAIVARRHVRVPGSARKVVRYGTEYRILEDGSRRIITWELGGRTCVVTADQSVPEATLLALAGWEAPQVAPERA
jgi:hypothetical protein